MFQWNYKKSKNWGCGPNSAPILALLGVLCGSRDRSRRFLEDFPRVLWLGAQILQDSEPQSRSAGGYGMSLRGANSALILALL